MDLVDFGKSGNSNRNRSGYLPNQKAIQQLAIEDLMPLSKEISDSFVPLPDSDYRDTFIEYLKTNGWLST